MHSNMERRYKRSRYKLMIADHLLPPGNHDTPSPSNTPCVSHRGKGKVPEQNWGAESEEEGKETNLEENPLGHLAQVVPEGQLPLQGNEAPGRCRKLLFYMYKYIQSLLYVFT